MNEAKRSDRLSRLPVHERALLGLILRSALLDLPAVDALLEAKERDPGQPLALLLEGHVSSDALDVEIAAALGKFYRLVEEGDSLARISNPHLAARKYSEALSIKPTDAGAHLHRALAYIALEETDLALADLDRAIEIDPRSQAALHARALLRLKGGEASLAITDLSRAIEIGPRPRLHLDRAKVYQIQGEALAALLDYNRATELDPRYASAWYHRGTLHLARRELGVAWECLRCVFDCGAPAGEFASMTARALEQLLASGDDPAVPAEEVRRLLETTRATGGRRRTISISGTERRPRLRIPARMAIVCALAAMLVSLAALLATGWWSETALDELRTEPREAVAPEGEARPLPATTLEPGPFTSGQSVKEIHEEIAALKRDGSPEAMARACRSSPSRPVVFFSLSRLAALPPAIAARQLRELAEDPDLAADRRLLALCRMRTLPAPYGEQTLGTIGASAADPWLRDTIRELPPTTATPPGESE